MLCCHTAKTFAYDYFDGISSNCVVNVLSGTRDTYTAAGWTESVFKGGVIEIDQQSSGNIDFADNNVKALCVANWDTDNDEELSYDEAAAVINLGEVFSHNSSISSFDELQYFTGLTSISDEAFSCCTDLSSVEIPNSVTLIGNCAFYGCSGLISIEIPNSVTSMSQFAFQRCTSLTSIVIPKSVTSIGGYAFNGCSGLSRIIVDSDNTVYDSRDNCNAIIHTSSNTLLFGCKNTVIPDGVTLASFAFDACSGLSDIEIPNSVTYIGESTFRDCDGLTNITIPSSVTSIGLRAFYGCNNLSEVTIQNGVTSIGNEAFLDCSSLSSIEIPNSVTSIGGSAFAGCSSLTSIEIPKSIISIGDWAFYNCQSLSSITSYVENPFEFGENVFSEISSNCVLYVPAGTRNAYIAAGWTENVFKGGVIESNGGTAETLAQAIWCEDNKTLYFLNSSTTYAIGDTYDGQTISNIWSGTEITNSGEPVWREFVMGNLTTVVFDQSFYDVLPTTLQSWFQGCKNLSSIIGLEYLNTSEATSMGCMFVDCSSLTSLDLSHFNTRQVTHMDGMFAACSSLVNIDLGSFNTENVVDMNQMFRGCKSLQTIDVSNFDMRNVINMGEMFRGCEMLESINFSGVRTDNLVGMAATFAECPNLKTLDLSSFTTSNVDNMWYTFGACNSLESLDLRNFETDKVMDISGIFLYDHNLKTIYCDNTWHLNSDYPIFEHCNSLVGGTGFSYDENKVTSDYANPGISGYFTTKKNIDATSLLVNPKFQDGFNGWTKHSGTAGGLKAFPCVEVYENTVDVYQEVHNVPAGIYAISVKAFERPALNGNYDGNEKSKVYLYMNQFETPVQNIVKSAIPVDEAIDKENCFISGGYPTEAFFQTDGTTFADYLFSNEEFSGYVPNGMSGASYAFRADRYNQTCYGLVGEDGVMKIGLTSKGENCHWVLWADFKLTYMAKDKTALASVIGYYADLASQITDAGTPDILTLNDAINRAQAATDGETMYTELFNIVEAYNVAIESQKAYPEAISSYEKLRNALDEYGNTASEDVLDEANALFTDYSGLENYEFAGSELSDMVEEMEQTVIRLKNSSDFNQNSTISSLTIKKDYELAIPFTAGKQYENKTANIMLDGIYDVLGVNAENIYETIALKVYAEVTRSFTETWTNELTGKLMTLTDIRTETEGWFGRYTNSKNGTETVLEINAPKPHGSGCTFYIQNISLVNGELSFTTGQYPGTLKIGDTDYTYLYIVSGTNAVRIKVYVDVTDPEYVPQDELELAGETTIDIAMNPMSNNRTKAFSIDMEAIAAALECETSDIDDVFSWTDSGEMSNSHTEISGGFYFNNDSKIGNWSSNIENTAPFFISVSSLSDGAFAIGQYANYYKNITEDVNLTPDLIFIVGSKYYIVHVRYRITNDDLNNLDTWTCVYSAAYDVQLIDDEGYGQAAESQTSLDLDEIAAAIGSSNPKLYAEYWTTAEDGTESMICTDAYSCSPYPGFWMTGDGRSAGEWGNSPSYGMTYANNGVITYYCISGAHNAGDEFTSRFYLVNEDNGKYAQITLNAAFVDYRGTSFSAEADDVYTGEETTLSVRMDNNKDIIMTEFYLQLPDGFEIAMDEDGNYQAELNSDRSNGHQLEVGCSNDGIYHFLCYSSRNNTFNSNSGDLINIRLVCSDDVETGTYEGKFMNFVISDVNLNEYNPEDFIFNIEVKNILMGDVNADTRINGLDIVEMVDKILDRPVTGTFIFAAGDFDANGVINGMDLVEEVSLVLSQTASGAKARKAPERLEPDMASTMRMSKNNNGDISVGVESTDDYILAQFVVEFSKGLQLKDFISADRDHVVAWQPIEGNRYMVVCYSMRNETFVDNNDLLRISYEGEGIIKVTDAMLVDKDRNPHYIRNTEYGETTGIELVNGTFTTPTDIYSVTGAIVKKNAKSTKGLGKGIYVVNGKVITIK